MKIAGSFMYLPGPRCRMLYMENNASTHLRSALLVGFLLSSMLTAAETGPYRPRLYFGTVNSNAQLLEAGGWPRTRARVDGMLLHLHFFLRHMETPGNRIVTNADKVIRGLAPLLAGKSNLIELTFHIRDAKSSPEQIGRTHASNIAALESLGIPIAGVTADWILSILEVQTNETPRTAGEAREAFGQRILAGVVDKSARYLSAFRASGRSEPVYAVYPPLYLDEGPWTNARRVDRFGLTTSRIVEGLARVGFAGFVADSPFGVMANATYRGQGYFDALRSIQATCRSRGIVFGLILNGDNKAEAGEAYDLEYGANTVDALSLLLEQGLRPDPLVLESWYRGPYRLVPETLPGSFTHTVLEVARRLDAP